MTAANDGVDVGCTMTGVALASCTVKLYADPKGATASSQVLIGTGTAKASKTTGKLIVRVKLNATGPRPAAPLAQGPARSRSRSPGPRSAARR